MCANTKFLLGLLPFVGKVQISTNSEDFTVSRLLGKAPGTDSRASKTRIVSSHSLGLRPCGTAHHSSPETLSPARTAGSLKTEGCLATHPHVCLLVTHLLDIRRTVLKAGQKLREKLFFWESTH